MPLLRALVALAMLATAYVAYASAVDPLGHYGRGDHALWWLLFQEVHEVRAGRGNAVRGQALLDLAAREVAAGRADAQLVDLVHLSRGQRQ